MTTQTTAPAPNKICTCCALPFTSKRADAKACSPACRKALSRASQVKKDDKRIERFRSSAIGQYLVGQCKRAGTVAILPRTLEALTELYQVHAYAMQANNYGASNEYSICHISPVTQKAWIGTLHPQNLAVAPTKLNAGFGNKSFPAAGHRILKAKISPVLRIEQDATKANTLDAIVSYLTPALVCQWVVKCKIQCTQKAKLIAWFTTHELAIDDERVPSLAGLHDMTGKQLSDLQAELTGKKTGFKVDGYIFYPYDVFRSELQRLAKHSAPLAELQSVLYSRGYGWGFVSGYQFSSDAHAAAQFNALHGGPADDLLALFPAKECQPTPEAKPERTQTPAEYNAWLRSLQTTFPELAEGYELMLEGAAPVDQTATAPEIAGVEADLSPAAVELDQPTTAPAPKVHKLQLPWEAKPKPQRSSFADELDTLPSPSGFIDDDDDDWSHLDVYLTHAA